MSISPLEQARQLREIQRRAKKELHFMENVDLLYELWRTMPVLAAIFDFEKQTFDFLSDAWTTELGWEVKELEGKNLLPLLIHPEDLERTFKAAEKSKEYKEHVNHFYNRYRCKDGGYRWLKWYTIAPPHELKQGAHKALVYALIVDHPLHNPDVQAILLDIENAKEEKG